MQYTTNYNLITVEGTDVVNPLVQMNPNFTDIDAAMFANKQATIGSASEIVSGTVHAITRANTDSNYFRYTATGNWTTGDSMSVDGVNVSVYLTDGTTPGTGSYVINSEVFGMISGSRVTLFLATSPVTSLAASQITFDPTGTGLDPADTDVDKALKDIDSIINPGSVTVTGDGIKTYSQLLNALYGLIDGTKIKSTSTLVFNDGTGDVIFSMSSFTSADYKFIHSWTSLTALEMSYVAIRASSVYGRKMEGSAGTDYSGVIAPSGYTLTVMY